MRKIKGVKNIQISKGFSLIEILITVAIVGIIAGYALTSYSSQAQKAKRSEATKALLDAAARQERYFMQNNIYITAAANFAEIGIDASAETENGYYALTISNQPCSSDACFTITASAQGGQLQDTNCTVFTIDNYGRKISMDNNGVTSSSCWD